ncbi:hypothetical protein [Allonocardiopsis opalescens]|uniref:HNH endonuclease n=1 Tax=Allonocardiopsis opalescens TaxID=1144618 RepID=A0A2T0PP45_9ACTN|nr:hypothetical protein [Allonocardiopsis opalescens]PRX90672.1 hypothetical protein CLV72_11810 [Allonocardiopsis opalescens]
MNPEIAALVRRLEAERLRPTPPPPTPEAGTDPLPADAVAKLLEGIRRKPTGAPVNHGGIPNRAVEELVWDRDGGTCGWCGKPVKGPRRLHRRKARHADGSFDLALVSPANLVLVHAGTECVTEIDTHPIWGAETGFRINPWDDPAARLIQYAHLGWVELTDDGGLNVVLREVRDVA